MVNMNHFKDPAIYGLTAPDGGVFYVGRTAVNALNRWWEHKSRANSGHGSPVYRKMREIGVEKTGWVIIERFSDIPPGASPREREAQIIAGLIRSGVNLVNSYGTDGKPDTWSDEKRKAGFESRRGKPTWIAGKCGEEAGWTEERRKAQAAQAKMRHWKKEIENPELLYARIDKIEYREAMNVRRAAAMEMYGLDHPPKSPSRIASHGTRTMWEKHKCKCTPCRDAGARRNAKKRGKPDWQNAKASGVE